MVPFSTYSEYRTVIFLNIILFCTDASKRTSYFLFVALLVTNSITCFHSPFRLGNHTPETFLLLLWLVSHGFSTRVRQSNFTVISRVIKRIYHMYCKTWRVILKLLCCQHGHLSFSLGSVMQQSLLRSQVCLGKCSTRRCCVHT